MRIILLLTIMLSGCATPPQWLADSYDRNDPCQQTHLIKTGQYPSYCGSKSGPKYITRDYTTGRYVSITQVQR